jgi:rhodanese-related sulfurtransferase
MSGPLMVNLEFAKYHFDVGFAIFIDARDPEDYESGHIKDAINIPYDYYEDYQEIIDALDDAGLYIIYCSGEECSLSIDLADYLYNDKLIDKLLIFEGGWPEWRDEGYP